MKTIHTLIILIIGIILFSCQGDKKTEHLPETVIPEKVVRSELDTFNLGDIAVQVEKITKSEFYALPANAVIDTAEAGNIAADSAVVKRIGDSLFIKTVTKEVQLITKQNDEDDVDNYVVYEYSGYIKSIDQFLVSGSYYEAYDYLLVDNQTGDITHLWGTPVASPNGALFVVANSDLEAGFTYNGIQLFSNTHTPVLIAQRELKEFGPEEIRWQDDKTLLVKAGVFDSNAEGGEHTEYFKLRFE